MKKITGRFAKGLGLIGMLVLCLTLTGCVVPADDIGANGNYVVSNGDLPFQSMGPINKGPTATPYNPPTATPSPTPTRTPFVNNPVINPYANPGSATNTPTNTPVGVISVLPNTNTGAPVSANVLKNGSTGSEVRKLQERLKELGYLKGSADGDFGDATETAVKNFQAQNGLGVDGMAGANTLNRLYSASAKKAPSTTVTNTPKPTNTPFTSYKNGDTGSEVRKLQQRLKTLGYLDGAVDGDFGDATEKAVKAFQRNNGLTADGKAGEYTLDKLYSSSAKPAVTATPKPTNTPAPTSLKKGDEGSDVREMQKRLKELGYLDSVVDGSFGDATEEAVKAFQRRNGLTADGKAGTVTLGKLYSDSAKAAATATPTPQGMKKGDEGSDVWELQKRLRELGYLNSVADGSYGDATEEAVKAFQRRNGLTADGKAGPVTLGKLYSDSAKAAVTATPKPTNSPVPDTMKKGDEGASVKDMQKRLKELGYITFSPDGEFGLRTEEAVKAFQSANGLTPDGKVGIVTLTKLYSESAKHADEGPTPTAKPTATPKAESLDYYLRVGSTGSKVRTLQNRLIALGWLAGSADGSFTYSTEYAVKAFQARYSSLWKDGIAGPDTLKLLYSEDAASTKTPAACVGVTLELGDKGDAVKAMQKRLRELDYINFTADGEFGDRTKAAVIAFQIANELTANGKANKATLDKLFSNDAKDANTFQDEEDARNEEDIQEPEDVTDIEVGGYTTLREGVKGDAVKELQRALKNHGYYANSIDGNYAAKTASAVKAFQEKNGLKADGVAGPATQAKLFGSEAADADVAIALKIGDYGPEVRNLQYVLYELGYYEDPIDGDYGISTENAVRAFQINNDLDSVDGVAGTQTLKVLYSGKAIAAAAPTSYTPLSKGDKGSLVVEMQELLVKLGYLSEVTGEYDSATVEAVKNFQRRNALSVDGKAGQETQAVLYSKDPKPAW